MEPIIELKEFDWWTIFLGIIVAILAFKFLYELFEWGIKKFGIETKSMREKRESKELLKETSILAKETSTLAKETAKLAKNTDVLAKETAANLEDLEERHTEDEKTFRNNLNDYMAESRKDRKALHDEMAKFTTNRQNDRAQSIEIQKELSNSIKEIAIRQDDRDKKINNLTELFVDKQISDYRWEIINLADKISDGKKVSKEALRHAIATHAKYEQIIEEHGLTNGEVDISMEIINEELKNRMSENIK